MNFYRLFSPLKTTFKLPICRISCSKLRFDAVTKEPEPELFNIQSLIEEAECETKILSQLASDNCTNELEPNEYFIQDEKELEKFVESISLDGLNKNRTKPALLPCPTEIINEKQSVDKNEESPISKTLVEEKTPLENISQPVFKKRHSIESNYREKSNILESNQQELKAVEFGEGWFNNIINSSQLPLENESKKKSKQSQQRLQGSYQRQEIKIQTDQVLKKLKEINQKPIECKLTFKSRETENLGQLVIDCLNGKHRADKKLSLKQVQLLAGEMNTMVTQRKSLNTNKTSENIKRKDTLALVVQEGPPETVYEFIRKVWRNVSSWIRKDTKSNKATVRKRLKS